MTNGHGDDRHLYPGTSILHDFSSNVPPCPDHTELWAHINQHQELITRYPEPEPYSLEEEIANKYGISPNSVLVTNGATEAIFLIAHHLKGKHSGIVQPTFSEYLDASLLYEHTTEHLSTPFAPNPRVNAVWCCNPNNPTGTTWDHDQLLASILQHPKVCFIFDQSYHSFTPKPVLSHSEICAHPNIIAIFSLTKKYALPGLRLGYLVTSENQADEIRKLRMPWSVNSLAIEAGHFLLNREPFWEREKLIAERKRVVSLLEQNTQLEISPTDTHYFLAKLPASSTAQELKDWLVEHYGILIRNADNFPTLSAQHIRIAIQSPEDNNQLIKALSEWSQI